MHLPPDMHFANILAMCGNGCGICGIGCGMCGNGCGMRGIGCGMRGIGCAICINRGEKGNHVGLPLQKIHPTLDKRRDIFYLCWGMCNYFTAKRANVSTFGYIYTACIAGSPIIYKNGLCGGFIGSNYATKSSNYLTQKNISELSGSNVGTNSSGNGTKSFNSGTNSSNIATKSSGLNSMVQTFEPASSNARTSSRLNLTLRFNVRAGSPKNDGKIRFIKQGSAI
jgi:hypothetical protein